MALPDVSTFTLNFGPYTDAEGLAALVASGGKLFFVDPSTNRKIRLTHVTSGQVIVPDPVSITIASDGTGSVGPIPHTGQAAFSPQGAALRVEWNIASNKPSPGNLTFVVPSGATADFDLLVPADTIPAVAISQPTVASVNGHTGPVVLDAEDVGALAPGDGAGGALSGTYPNPGLNVTAVDNAVAGTVDDTGTATGAALREASDAALAVGRDPGIALGGHVLALARGTSGQWDDDAVESLFPFWDHTAGRWGGTYVGYGIVGGSLRASVGLAFSDDLIHWEKTGASVFAPTLSTGDPDVNGTSGPVIWHENGVWYLIYIGLTAIGYEGGAKTICLATTTDDPSDWTPASWTRRGVKIAASGTGWRAEAVWHCSVVKRGATFYVFFNATGVDHVERIGYATTGSLLGTWTVDDANSPLIDVSPTGWDSAMVGDPSVYRVGEGWLMSYFGVDETTGAASDGIAYTTDDAFPLGWTKHPSNPILTPGAAGTFDEKYAHKPVVIHSGGVAHHFYTAVTTRSVRQVGVAVTASTTNPAPPVPIVNDAFDRADSTTDLGTAPTGQAWTVSGGTWGITDGQAYSPSAGGMALVDPGVPAGRIDVRVTGTMPPSGQAIGLVLRNYSADVHYELDIKGGAEGVELVQFNFGATAVAVDPGAWFSSGDLLSVIDDGTQIIVLKNDEPVIRYVTTLATRATSFGIKVYATDQARFDSFVAYGRDAAI